MEFSGDHSARRHMHLEIRGSPFAILPRNEAGTRIRCCSKNAPSRFDSHVKGRRTRCTCAVMWDGSALASTPT